MGEMMDFEKLWRHNQGALFLKEENQSIEWKKSIAQYFFQYGQKFSEDSLQSQLAQVREENESLKDDRDIFKELWQSYEEDRLRLVTCDDCGEQYSENQTEKDSCTEAAIIGGEIVERDVATFWCFKCQMAEQKEKITAELSAARESAERWDALMSSDRIRMIGSAQLGKEHQHLGLEIWEKYPGEHTLFGKEALMKYVDSIRSRKQIGGKGG